jgi:nitroreductase
MKKRMIFSLLIIVVLTVTINSFAEQKDGNAGDALSVIHSRKSVRNFTGEAVSKEDLEKIVRAGMAAPTAVNKQPWSFVVVTDRKTLDTLRDELPSAKMLNKAAAAIIVCAIPENAHEKKTELAVIDSTCASENILLAVEALRLGAVWTLAYPDNNRMTMIRRTLNIPENIIPVNVIPIGHPAGTDKPKDKYKPENVHWEKW